MYEHLVASYGGLATTLLTEVTEHCVVSKRLGYWIFVSRDRFGFVPVLFREQILSITKLDVEICQVSRQLFDGFYTLTLT